MLILLLCIILAMFYYLRHINGVVARISLNWHDVWSAGGSPLFLSTSDVFNYHSTHMHIQPPPPPPPPPPPSLASSLSANKDNVHPDGKSLSSSLFSDHAAAAVSHHVSYVQFFLSLASAWTANILKNAKNYLRRSMMTIVVTTVSRLHVPKFKSK